MTKRGRMSVTLALVMCLACSMTGCGKKNVAEELQELGDGSSVETLGETGDSSNKAGNNSDKAEKGGDEVMAETGALAKKLGVPEEPLDYTVKMDGGTRQYNVDAEVLVAADQVGVYEEQLLNLTEDKVMAYARNLFDGGNYEQIKPYAACTKDELTLLKSDAEKTASERSYTYVEDEWYDQEKLNELDFYLEHYIEPVEKYEEGKYYNCQYYKAAKMDSDLAGYLLYYSRIMILEGTIGGTPYQLVAYQADPAYGDCVNSYLRLYREGETWSQCSWQPSTGHFTNGDNWSQENICELTEEEAMNTAKDYMDMMGFDNMEVVQKEYLFWQRTPAGSQEDDAYSPETVLDGYSFHMARTYDKVSGMYIPTGWEWLSGDGSSYAEQESYVVNVDSRGIVSVETGTLYENTKTVSEDTELMSFTEIDKKAQTVFEEEIGKLMNDDEEGEEKCQDANRPLIRITNVKLAYANLQYEGKFKLMPVWIYTSLMNNLEYPEIIINAVDGTRVKTNDNIYKCVQ